MSKKESKIENVVIKLVMNDVTGKGKNKTRKFTIPILCDLYNLKVKICDVYEKTDEEDQIFFDSDGEWNECKKGGKAKVIVGFNKYSRKKEIFCVEIKKPVVIQPSVINPMVNPQQVKPIYFPPGVNPQSQGYMPVNPMMGYPKPGFQQPKMIYPGMNQSGYNPLNPMGGTIPQPSTVPGKKVVDFTKQLKYLADMGYTNVTRNTTLLKKYNGDINEIFKSGELGNTN